MKVCIFFRGYVEVDAPLWAHDLQEALPEHEVKVWQEGDAPADYAVTWRATQAFIDHQTRLRALFNAGAGVDALLQLQLPQTLQVVRIEDSGMAQQMIEYVSHALLRFYREFDFYAQQQAHGLWEPRQVRDKQAFPVGILGLGVLGRQVAQAVQQLGFPVAGWSRTAKQGLSFACHAGDDGLHHLLSSSRILVCLLPLTSATQGIINARTLALLKPDGYLINIARGGHVVEPDLLAALDQGTLAGAMLDVFAQEPLPLEHPFWKHPKVTITPHVAAVTPRANTIRQIAEKIRLLDRGETVSGVVDKQLGY